MAKTHNSLKSTLADRELIRRGGFTKQGIKIRIGEDVKFRESKSRLKSDLEARFKNKSDGGNRPETGLFVTNLTMNGVSDVTKKVRMPKNRTSQKLRKKEMADAKNHNDGISAERIMINPLWEAWCKYDSYIDFTSFEREVMKYRVYKKRLNAVIKKMKSPA